MVLAAHGTRDPAGASVTEALAAGVAERGLPVAVAYADVRAPDVTAVLGTVAGSAVVVPAFLAAGYHVRTDIPAQVAASGHGGVRVSAALGPAPELIGALHDRLREAGYRAGDAVVLAAAGSSDPRALREIDAAAAALGARLGVRVRVAFAATAAPSAAAAVTAARRDGGRVAVASWLLAPGRFQRRIAGCGADVVAEPLGAHDAVADLVVRRYLSTLVRNSRARFWAF